MSFTGRILQGIGGFYTVRGEEGDFVCKPRGHFRKQGLTPMVGDYVTFTPGAPGDEGSIDALLPRENALLRPPVANVDLLLITLACSFPQPDLLLVDRLLVRARQANMDAALVLNKCDQGLDEAVLRQYALSGYRCFPVSALTGEGVEGLRALVGGKTVCLAGQSAVGKSSLINLLAPEARMEVGDLSRIERGRHTTRKARLLPMAEDGYLVDTPGFSLLELDRADPERLKDAYPEFTPYEKDCRFLGCNHIAEPDCAVRRAAQEGLLSIERLQRYATLFEEQKLDWRNRYD